MIPNFHDGYFDGLRITGEKTVHLYARTVDQVRFTMTLRGVKTLRICNIRQGNIIFDFSVLDASQLTASHIEALDEFSDVARDERIARALTSAQDAHLKFLDITASYGAEGAALFESIEVTETES